MPCSSRAEALRGTVAGRWMASLRGLRRRAKLISAGDPTNGAEDLLAIKVIVKGTPRSAMLRDGPSATP